MNMPGFSAVIVFESKRKAERYSRVLHGSFNKSIAVPQLRIECDVNESFLDCAKLIGICDTYGGGMSSTGAGRYACDL